MIRSQNGTSCGTSLETERKHCAEEKEKGETGWTPKGKQSDPITGVASDGAADNQFEYTCRRGQRRRLWSEKDTSSTDRELRTKRKQRRLEQSARRRARVISMAGGDPTLANLSAKA